MRSLEGGNQLRERASHPNPCLDPSQSSPRTCVPPLGRPASPQYLQPLPDLSSTPSCVSPTLTHPATRMMTRSGSPATVIKKSAKAGPKATKVHPKNTAAPIAWQLGAERRPGPERRMGGARQLESPRGVATRPRKGRGAMSPPDPGEGEGGAPKIPNTGPRDFLYGSREGDKPGRSRVATSHLIPTPKANGESAGAELRVEAELWGGAGPPGLLGVVVSCFKARDLDPGSGSNRLKGIGQRWAGSGFGFLGSVGPWLRIPFVILWRREVAILPLLEELQREEDPVRT